MKEQKGFIPIAKIEESKDKKLNNEILFLNPSTKDDSDSDSDFDYELQDVDMNSYFKGMKPRQAVMKSNELAKHLSKKLKPVDDEMANIYKKVKEDSSKDFKLKSGIFVPIPDINKSRNIYYLFGASGSGKSYLSASILKQWLKLNDGNIYVFSALDDDKVIDALGKRVHRVDIETLEEKMDIKEIPDGSMVLFDDVDTLNNNEQKTIYENLQHLLNQVLQIGRHNKISAIITSHLASDYKRTRVVLNESHYIIIYPQSGSFYQNSYLLKHYCGMSSQDIQKVKKMKTRWAMVHRQFPQYVLGEHECYLLSG